MSVADMLGPRRRGLGRGLDALLSRPGDRAADLVVEVDPDRVDPNPEQPRRDFDAEELTALADSIRLHGLLQPIVVEPMGDDRYQLVAGERRLRAARLAGVHRVPAVVRPPTESGRQALELALTENLLRADLSPLEEAAAYTRLADAFGMSHEAIAQRVGRSRPAVTNTVRLLNLAPEVQELLTTRRISAGHARALLGVEDAAAQVRLAGRAATEGLTVRALEALVARGSDVTAAERAPEQPQASREDDALARGLEAVLGTAVQIRRRRGGGGQVVIAFAGDEDLGALYDRLGGAPL